MTEADGQIDRDAIARRAYDLAQTGDGSRSDEENWLQAEHEVRAEQEATASAKKSRKRKAAAVETVPEAD